MTLLKKRFASKYPKIYYPTFIELKNNYTEFGFKIALSLKSKYAKRIYEMLSQHKKEKGFNISVKELKWRLGLIKKEKEEKLSRFYTFKKQVLETAQRASRPPVYLRSKKNRKEVHRSRFSNT